MMSKIDTAELVRILTTAPQQPAESPRGSATTAFQSEHLSALRLRLQSILGAGFDSEKLKEIALKNRTEVRSAAKQKQLAIAKQLPQQEAALLRSLATRRAALESLRFGQTPPQYFLLEEPFLIWQTPLTPEAITETSIEPNNSWMKVLIDTNFSAEQRQPIESQPPQPEGIAFTFYFYWQNDSQFTAVTNISTFLILTGAFELVSESGFFSGDKVTLSIEASLSPMEWWTQPPGAPIAEQSQTQPVLHLHAQGGGFWDNLQTGISYDVVTHSIALKPIELNYNLFSVPPNELAIFQVTLEIAYNYPTSGNSGDEVKVDFSSDQNRILCPYFLVEVLPSNQTIVAEP